MRDIRKSYQKKKKEIHAGKAEAKYPKLPSPFQQPSSGPLGRTYVRGVLCACEVCCDPFLSVDLLPALCLLMRLQRIPEKEVLLTALLPLENPHTPFLPEACSLPSSAYQSSRRSLPLGAARCLLLHFPVSLSTLGHWRSGLSCWTSEKAPLSH